jgi:2,4-dienoyl-CoA reductase (NADPH2)
VANPLGCYDVRRFDGDQEAMVAEIMEVFHPSQFSAGTVEQEVAHAG